MGAIKTKEDINKDFEIFKLKRVVKAYKIAFYVLIIASILYMIFSLSLMNVKDNIIENYDKLTWDCINGYQETLDLLISYEAENLNISEAEFRAALEQ